MLTMRDEPKCVPRTPKNVYNVYFKDFNILLTKFWMGTGFFFMDLSDRIVWQNEHLIPRPCNQDNYYYSLVTPSERYFNQFFMNLSDRNAWQNEHLIPRPCNQNNYYFLLVTPSERYINQFFMDLSDRNAWQNEHLIPRPCNQNNYYFCS
jgi:hypothetical protein